MEASGGEPVRDDLEILRRIDPSGGEGSDGAGIDLEGAWTIAAADVVEVHNARTDARAMEESIGPKQRWALDVLRDPGVAYVAGAELAEEALSVGRSSAVRKAISAVEGRVVTGQLTLDEAAGAVVGVVSEFGLQPVQQAPLPRPVGIEDLGVVCWMGVQDAA